MARHQMTVHLEGGQSEVIQVSNLEVSLDADSGNIASYNIETVEEEQISYLYFRPDKIVAIKAILLEADENKDS